jgi:hypothetical protein
MLDSAVSAAIAAACVRAGFMAFITAVSHFHRDLRLSGVNGSVRVTLSADDLGVLCDLLPNEFPRTGDEFMLDGVVFSKEPRARVGCNSHG